MRADALGQFLSQLPFQYRPAATRDPMMRQLQRLHNRHVFAHRSRSGRAAILLAGALVWPAWSAWLALVLARRTGPRARERGGPGRSRQFASMLWLALVHRWHPRDYYYFNFWRRPAKHPGDYVTDRGAQPLFRAMNRGLDVATLDDKRRFWERCRADGLAVAPLLATFSGGTAELLADDTAWQGDVFFKLRRGWHAAGAMLWRHEAADGTYLKSPDGPRLSRDELFAFCAQRSRQADCLLQPRLFDHPAVADLGNGALSTVRMVTVLDRSGRAQEFASIFNIPQGRAITNNLVDGALACPIDATTGTLRIAFSGALGKPQFARNPTNGATITGRALPHWAETIALACTAHERLVSIAVVGWDIALTAAGPVLLEGNHQIGLNFHQLPPNPPLAQTPLPALLVWHLQRKYGEHGGSA